MKKDNRIRRGCKLTAAMLLLSGLTACANPLTGIVELAMDSFSELEDNADGDNIEIREWELRKVEPDIQRIQEDEEEIEDEAVPLGRMASEDPYHEERRAAFVSVLEGMYNYQQYPDGRDMGIDDRLEELSENQFAVYDVDGDGKEELIVEVTTTITAGMCEVIYDYDEISRTIREEFQEFPALTIYSNGIIWAGWSHNQGLAGEFWPYNLYQYQPETDTYELVGEVDAWDKHFFQKDYAGNPFPDVLDADGNGLIYYITIDPQDKDTSPVDDEAYNQWINSYISAGEELVLPLRKLTEENIRQLMN